MAHGQIVGYVRVSTLDQNPARQVEALGQVDRLFTDHVSGKSRRNRPALTECLNYVREGDTLRVASMDRLARSLTDLDAIVDELTSQGVRVDFVREGQVYGPGSADPVSQLMLHLLGALAEFERALIHERQAEGIAVAKKQGRYRGRKPALSGGQLARARRLVAEGVPKTKVAAQLGVGRSTLYRALRS